MTVQGHPRSKVMVPTGSPLVVSHICLWMYKRQFCVSQCVW